MSSKIYVLAGVTGSGKTTLLNLIKTEQSLNVSIPNKYSNRIKRSVDDDIVKVDNINSDEYSFVYSMQDNFYGFKMSELVNPLKVGQDVFIIISDIRVIEEIRAYFGEYVSVLYIFRNISEQEFKEVLQKRESNEYNSKNNQIRKNRVYLIQRQYIENIQLFDYVILNRKKKDYEMLEQIKNIINPKTTELFVKPKKNPVIFLIAAASGAGKHTLIEAMYNLGSKSIKVIPKETDRPKQEDDGNEIIADVKDLENKYKIYYAFNKKKYGIDEKLIWENLKDGLPQIVITNMQQFSIFKSLFGSSIVNIYLHATRTEEELYNHQLTKLKGDKEKARVKVNNIEGVHKDYINNISSFHHVLLNTIEKEDLWDQMFRLIKYYKTC